MFKFPFDLGTGTGGVGFFEPPPYSINPGGVRSTEPIATPETIIDDPLSVYRQQMKTLMTTRLYNGQRKFIAVVLAVGRLDGEKSNFFSMFKTRFDEPVVPTFLCMIPDLHAHLPSPYDFIDVEDKVEAALRFPIYELADNSPESVNSFLGVTQGSLVEVEFFDAQRLTLGKVTKILRINGDERSAEDVAAADALRDNPSTPRRLLPEGQSVLDIVGEASINATESGIFVGDDLPVASAVNAEAQFWKGKNERSPEALSRLSLYWGATDLDSQPSNVPWSAAFVSYIIQKSGGSLPGSGAHWKYVEAAGRGEGGYGLLKTDMIGSTDQILPNLGDILVKPRSGTTGYETHGDVVWKIENNVAYLAGGNLGDSVKTDITVTLDEEGYYSGVGSYQSIVKLGARREDSYAPISYA